MKRPIKSLLVVITAIAIWTIAFLFAVDPDYLTGFAQGFADTLNFWK